MTPADFHTHDRFMRLYTAHYMRLHAYIGTFLYRGADVEDALQETSVTLWEKFSEFNPTDDTAASDEFGAWACTIARFKVMQAMRAHGRATVPLDESLIDMIVDKQAAMNDELVDRRVALKECLAKLPPTDRALIDACYRGERRFKDVADELGRPTNSVYKSLSRIRGSLMGCVDRTLRRESRS